MRFSTPLPAYDELRNGIFGSAEVPWEPSEEPSGTLPQNAAAAILARVAAADDQRLRVLVGEDAPGQVRAALGLRDQD